MYSPPVVTVRVCVYHAVTGSFKTVSVPSVTVMESLVQVTVVAGPPVEIQVRVMLSALNVTSLPDIVTSPPVFGETVIVSCQTSIINTISWIQSHIDCFSHRFVIITMDSNSCNTAAIDTSWSSNIIGTTNDSYLSCTTQTNRETAISEWQSSSSIREIPASTMRTLTTSTTCPQVSVTHNTVTIVTSTPTVLMFT